MMDLKDRAQRIVDTAKEANLHVRLLGGIALYLLAPSARTHAALQRSYKDIDLIVPRRDGGKLAPVLSASGFEADKRFNALHGETRLLFADPHNTDLQVDVFVGVFEQCHKLNLLVDSGKMTYTITPTQLLLSKLQIVELNEKDVRDLVTMLLDWPLGTDDSAINETTLSRIFGSDWGLATTSEDTLEKVRVHAVQYLSADEEAIVHSRIDALEQLMRTAPKTMKFRVRERIGRKVPWYEVPEEVNR